MEKLSKRVAELYLIVGCGLTGVVIAERIANTLKKPVLIVDRRAHIAGNIYDYKNKDFITIHKYGPHAFHTNSQKVWDYLSQFTKWEPYFHKVEAMVDGQNIPLPFNFNSLNMLFPKAICEEFEEKIIKEYGYSRSVSILELLESKELNFLAEYIYEKVFVGYTVKQWGIEPSELDRSVLSRVPFVSSRNNCYFQDKYQAIPSGGYTKMIEKMLDNPLIEVRLECDYKKLTDTNKYEKIIYTGMIDEFYEFKFGALPYRSLDFDFVTYGSEFFQRCTQVNYPNNFDFTRITEYKYFLKEKSANTVVSYEYPCEFKLGINDPYYPVPNSKNQALYERYRSLGKDNDSVIFAGRLGEYKYYNMDQAVERALEIFSKDIANA